jgi:hypothetical protein
MGATALSLIKAYTDNGTVPLITQATAIIFENAALNETLINLRNSMGPVIFNQLPINTQVSLADWAWRHDSGILNSTIEGQTVRADILNGQWAALASYLIKLGGTRNAMEAKLIRQDIAAGLLPPTGQPCA